jgi:serine/threonine-protein kinase RIO1
MQAVQLTHPHATKFLYRDIKNVTDFFCNRNIGAVPVVVCECFCDFMRACVFILERTRCVCAM